MEEQNTSLAKSVMYRALEACSWNKQLYLFAIHQFGPDFYTEAVDLMTEKEIRLRTLPEEADLLFKTAHLAQQEESSIAS